MNLKALKLFASNVMERLAVIHPMAVSANFYYLHSKKWHELWTGDVDLKEKKASFEQCRKSKRPVRPTKSCIVYFFVEKYQAVVEMEFSVAIRMPAQEQVGTAIKGICIDSENQFGASHDKHTGLKNRSSFDARIDELSIEFSQSGNEPSSEAGVSSSRQFALLSLDIDHFKSVNDRFGHGYGDVVLAAFSWRVERKCEEIVKDGVLGVTVDVFRLGGGRNFRS